MTTTAKHTPTPWHVNGIDAIHSVKGNRSVAKVYHAEDDAAFIVRACNAHDALYEACKAVFERCGMGSIYTTDQVTGETFDTLLRAALAKADGGGE